MKFQLSLLLLSILISVTTGQEGGHDQPPDGGNDHEKNSGNSSGNGSDGKAEDGYSQGFNRGIKPYSYGYNTGVKPYSYNFYQPLGGKKQETRDGGEEDNNGKEIILIKNRTQLNRKNISRSKSNETKNLLPSPDDRFTDLIRSENEKRNQVLKPGAVYDDEHNQNSNQDPNDQNQDSDQTDFNKGDNEMNEDDESNSNDDPPLPTPSLPTPSPPTPSPFQPHSQIPGMYYTPVKFLEFSNHVQCAPKQVIKMPNRFKVVDTRMVVELVMVSIDMLVDKVDTIITMDRTKEHNKDHLQLSHRFLFPSISLL